MSDQPLRIERLTDLRYAAYGSNLHPGRLTRRLTRAKLEGSGFVASHRLTFYKKSVDGSGKCCLLSPGDGVWVAVYTFDRASKALLDDIEGVGRGYEIATLNVPRFGTCYTYAAAPGYVDDRLLPYDWYRDLVILGCDKLGFPADYVQRIKDQPCTPDPDDARAAENRRLVAALQNEA